MHPALHHHVRRSGRDPKRWNVACDFAINPLLVDAGLSLPDGVLLDDRFRGMSAEQIYNLLESESESETDQDSGHEGERRRARRRGIERRDVRWRRFKLAFALPLPKVELARFSMHHHRTRKPQLSKNRRGSGMWRSTKPRRLPGRRARLPAGLHRTLDGAAEAAIDWREMLRRLWSETTPADYSWTRPNRRHIWAGLYLPGVIREGVGEIAIAVDCSGSVTARQLRLFEAEVRSILEGQRPERVYVLYFDAAVQKVETYEAGQRVDLQPVGGGGTEFGPCFEWLDERGILPQTMVFLTDLYGSFPDSAPAYPVLWASTGSPARSLWRSHPHARPLSQFTGLPACMFRQHVQGRADSITLRRRECSGRNSEWLDRSIPRQRVGAGWHIGRTSLSSKEEKHGFDR